jgi:hypothetical protein
VLGEHLRRRYFHGSRGADLAILLRNGEAELLDATPDDVDRIAVSMVTLATVLQDAFAPPPDHESLPPTVRGAARVTADTARILSIDQADLLQDQHRLGVMPGSLSPRRRSALEWEFIGMSVVLCLATCKRSQNRC